VYVTRFDHYQAGRCGAANDGGKPAFVPALPEAALKRTTAAIIGGPTLPEINYR
jgi:hypothetical protein